MNHSRPQTPFNEEREVEQEYHTPQRARVIALSEWHEYLQRTGRPATQAEIFRFCGVPRSSGYRILKDNQTRRLHNRQNEDPRGPRNQVPQDKIIEMDEILQTEGIEARSLTWGQLGTTVGLNLSGRTIQRAMGLLNWAKCIACQKGWVNERTAQHRKDFANISLAGIQLLSIGDLYYSLVKSTLVLEASINFIFFEDRVRDIAKTVFRREMSRQKKTGKDSTVGLLLAGTLSLSSMKFQAITMAR